MGLFLTSITKRNPNNNISFSPATGIFIFGLATDTAREDPYANKHSPQQENNTYTTHARTHTDTHTHTHTPRNHPKMKGRGGGGKRGKAPPPHFNPPPKVCRKIHLCFLLVSLSFQSPFLSLLILFGSCRQDNEPKLSLGVQVMGCNKTMIFWQPNVFKIFFCHGHLSVKQQNPPYNNLMVFLITVPWMTIAQLFLT